MRLFFASVVLVSFCIFSGCASTDGERFCDASKVTVFYNENYGHGKTPELLEYDLTDKEIDCFREMFPAGLAYKNGNQLTNIKEFFIFLKGDEIKAFFEDDVSPSIMKSLPILLTELEILLEGPASTLFKDGVPLDLDILLAKKNNKTPLNIFYLNSLENDSIKQFFLSYLCNEIYAYMLKKGKINLLFFIDEVKIFSRDLEADEIKILYKE